MFFELRHLARTLRRSPASAFAAVVTLALTLGAGVSIFAVVDAVLLTPPPFTDPDALAMAGEVPRDQHTAPPRAVAYSTFMAWRARAEPMAGLEASDGTNLTLTGHGAATRLQVGDVTPGWLTLLGVVPTRGRLFTAADVGQPVVVVSHALWRSTLAADPHAVGRVLVLGNQPHTVVGVLPDGFFTFAATDLWRPLPANAEQRGARVQVLARLHPGVTSAALAHALDEVSSTNAPPANALVTPMRTVMAGGASATLGLLAGAAGLAAVLAFTNLAGLLLVRSLDRRRELAVRVSLGARHHEIVWQLLLEAQALVALGIGAGVLLALWMTPIVGRLALEQFGDLASREVVVSWRAIASVSLLASACAWLCGLIPAFAASRWSVMDVLRRGLSAAPRERATRHLVVVAEIAMAFVLLIAVALLGRSLVDLLRINPGFEPRGVLDASVSLPSAVYPREEQVVSFYRTLHAVLDARLGAGTVAIVDEVPLTGDRGRSVVSTQPGHVGPEAVMRTASAGYFDVMQIHLVAGRAFDARDDASAPLRVVVSRALAVALPHDTAAVGSRIWLAALRRPAEIVGVVDDVTHRALDERTVPTVYLSSLQEPSRNRHVLVRSDRPEADVMALVRDEVARLDRDVPVYTVRTLAAVVATSPGIPARRVLTAAFVGFAILAVVLAAVGLFGIAAHDVARRRAELALRVALGANPAQLQRAVLAHGLATTGLGLGIGALLAWWMVRTLGNALVVPGRVDIAGVTLAAIVLTVVGLVAVLPAARRAARTDPLAALRGE